MSKVVLAWFESIRFLTLPYKHKNGQEASTVCISVTFKSHSHRKLAIWQLRKTDFSCLKEINWCLGYLYWIVQDPPCKMWKEEEKHWHRSEHSELIRILTAARWNTYDPDGRVSTVEIEVIRIADVAQNLQTKKNRPLKGKSESNF